MQILHVVRSSRQQLFILFKSRRLRTLQTNADIRRWRTVRKSFGKRLLRFVERQKRKKKKQLPRKLIAYIRLHKIKERAFWPTSALLSDNEPNIEAPAPLNFVKPGFYPTKNRTSNKNHKLLLFTSVFRNRAPTNGVKRNKRRPNATRSKTMWHLFLPVRIFLDRRRKNG